MSICQRSCKIFEICQKMFTKCISQGVTVGLLAGQTFTIWTLVGSLLYPGSPVQKPTYIDSCPIEKQYYVGLANVSLSSSHSLPNFENEHTGILALYHIAFLLVPISGFVISLVVGTVMSLLTGICTLMFHAIRI